MAVVSSSVQVANRPDFAERLWVVVPSFNEGKIIAHTVGELCRHGYRVVAVDDGSADETSAEALSAGAVVVRHPFNLGYGAALQTGIRFALDRGATAIATFDADGQHHVEDLQTMVDALRTQGADVALGNRFAGRAENISPLRVAMLRAAVLFTSLTTGVRLSDAHNGLRVLTRAAAQRIDLRQDRYAYASEFVSEIARNRLRFVEVPVTITYSQYSMRKGQKLSSSLNILADLFVGWLLR